MAKKIPEKKLAILKQIICLQKNGKKVPMQMLLKLAKCPQNKDSQPIYGPYLQLVTDVLYPPAATKPLFADFSFNIQYYNQGGYYVTYPTMFTDTTGGPYGMTQSASLTAIANYFASKYTTVPQEVADSMVGGKLLTANAGDSGYVDLDELAGWFTTGQTANIPCGGYMLWSCGFYSQQYPSDKLVSDTFAGVSAKYIVMYIGAGEAGYVYTAEGQQVYAFASDPDGTQASTVLTSYANAGFNRLILCFWNYDSNSDWVTDWTSVTQENQQQIVTNLKQINPDLKLIVSGGGAYGNTGPASGVTGTVWGTALAQYALNNHCDGIDLDLEGSMLGVYWNIDQYQWLKDAVNAIAATGPNLAISFAPVAPLICNPNS